jgi:uncharacterized protein
MKTKTIVIVMILAALAAGITVLVLSGKKDRHVSIGTGSEQGVYYPVGGAVASIVNHSEDYDFQLTVETSAGSVENINQVMNRQREFGVVQADMQYKAYHGQTPWQGKPQEKLRAICSLHPETITLVAAVDSGIQSLADLEGKRVSIGAPGSGQRANAEAILAAADIELDDSEIEGLKPTEYGSQLQDGKIDAVFYTVGHPNGAIKELTAGTRRKVRFVPITGLDELLAQSPYYAMARIPLRHYPVAVNDEPVETISMPTTLVTHADVDEEIVYTITKAIFENVDQLKKQHVALEDLTREGMLEGLSAPLHPGAKRYLTEVGLIGS